MAGLGQYPQLMRALGLVIDLEVPLAGVPASSVVRVHPNLAGPAPMIPWTAYTLNVPNKLFVTTAGQASDVTNGMLLLSQPDLQYDVVEVDIDGGAEKTMDFSYNLARLGFGDAKSSIDTPDSYGLPSLRSAGFSVARVDRATRLVNTFNGAKNNNTQIVANPSNSKVTLFADDVTRGFRVDVWTSLSGHWHSLCLRDGTYRFHKDSLQRTLSDEGFVTVATSQSADGTSTDLRLPESLFRWAGWSLSAPRPGKTIGADSTAQPQGNPATTAIELQTSFTAQKGRCHVCASVHCINSARGRWISPATVSLQMRFWMKSITCRSNQFRICVMSQSPHLRSCCGKCSTRSSRRVSLATGS